MPGSGVLVTGAFVTGPKLALTVKTALGLKPRNPNEKSPPNGIPGPPKNLTTGPEGAHPVKELGPPRAVDNKHVRLPE